MSDPTYSYQLKPQKKDNEIWKGHYYLYLNRISSGIHSTAYIGQVTDEDPRVKLIILKRDNTEKLNELALNDAQQFAEKFTKTK